MLILMGKTASGKDSVVKELVTGYGYRYLIPYTTRPPRINEVKGKDYHYISQRDFCKKIKKGFFIEYQSYETKFGTWYYGIGANDFYDADDLTVTVLTPDGLRDVWDLLYDDTIIYLDVSERTIRQRLIARGDNKDEADRRIDADREDFKIATGIADFIVPTEHKTESQVAMKIIELLEDRERERSDQTIFSGSDD